MTKRKYGNKIKKEAIFLYLEGMGINAIGRTLELSQQLISYWIKKYGNIIKQLEDTDRTEYEVLEVDEMCTFLKKERIKSGYGLYTLGKTKKLLILK